MTPCYTANFVAPEVWVCGCGCVGVGGWVGVGVGVCGCVCVCVPSSMSLAHIAQLYIGSENTQVSFPDYQYGGLGSRNEAMKALETER